MKIGEKLKAVRVGMRRKKTEQEKLEEKREKILAKGSKFRYPMQVSRRKLMVATVVIGVVSVGLLSGALLWGLYHGQNTGEMMFRITRVLPLAVAEIDGEKVRFSDYLLIYRSSLAPIEQQTGKLGNSGDAEAMRTYYKRTALTGAEDLTFALKLARENEVSVGKEDLVKKWEEQRNVGGVMRSEASFLKVLKDNFGLGREEYERLLYLNLMKVRVTEKIDEVAKETAGRVEELIREKEGDLAKVAEEMKEKVVYEETGGMVGNLNVDGGRAMAAMGLEVGKVSERILSTGGDGYYFVKLLEKNEKEVSYVSLKVPFREFERRVREVRAREGVREFVKL